MINAIKLRLKHNDELIKKPEHLKLHKSFRGYPVLDSSLCDLCLQCVDVCAAKAIKTAPLEIDMGKCTFCGDCQNVCKNNAVMFTNEHRISTDKRDMLCVKSGQDFKAFALNAFDSRKEINKLFGRSLKLRQVSTGGCNACELELNASMNINFDLGRYGVDFVASPRSADGILITGPLTVNMKEALDLTFEAVPEPKIVILAGACAISGGVFAESDCLSRDFLNENKIDLYVPGCPVHPMTLITGIMTFLGKKEFVLKDKL